MALSNKQKQQRWRERQKPQSTESPSIDEKVQIGRKPSVIREGTPEEDPEQETEPTPGEINIPADVKADAEAAAAEVLKRLELLKRRKKRAPGQRPPGESISPSADAPPIYRTPAEDPANEQTRYQPGSDWMWLTDEEIDAICREAWTHHFVSAMEMSQYIGDKKRALVKQKREESLILSL